MRHRRIGAATAAVAACAVRLEHTHPCSCSAASSSARRRCSLCRSCSMHALCGQARTQPLRFQHGSAEQGVGVHSGNRTPCCLRCRRRQRCSLRCRRRERCSLAIHPISRNSGCCTHAVESFTGYRVIGRSRCHVSLRCTSGRRRCSACSWLGWQHVQQSNAVCDLIARHVLSRTRQRPCVDVRRHKREPRRANACRDNRFNERRTLAFGADQALLPHTHPLQTRRTHLAAERWQTLRCRYRSPRAQCSWRGQWACPLHACARQQPRARARRTRPDPPSTTRNSAGWAPAIRASHDA